MSLTLKWRFERRLIEDAPDFKGVYALWSGATPLAVGHALGRGDTIRSRLLAHLSRAASPGLASVTHYSWELCLHPLAREAELSEALGLLSRSRQPAQADG